jgi:hypothetical protein
MKRLFLALLGHQVIAEGSSATNPPSKHSSRWYDAGGVWRTVNGQYEIVGTTLIEYVCENLDKPLPRKWLPVTRGTFNTISEAQQAI